MTMQAWAMYAWAAAVALAVAAGAWTATHRRDVRPTLPLEHVAGATLMGYVVFVLAAACAVTGILRRRPWGAVLGIGLGSAIVAWRLLMLITTWQTFGDQLGGDVYMALVSTSMGLEAVPALVAIVLLARPLLRRTSASGTAPAEWPAETATPAG